MRICINCENEDSVVVCLNCSSFHYCCNDCKNEYERRNDNVLCPREIHVSSTLSVSGLILPNIIHASSYSLPALPQSSVSQNLPSIGNNINQYQHRQGSSTQLPIYSGHLNQPSSGSFTLPTLVQSTVRLNQQGTSGSTQLPLLIAPRSSPALTNRIQRLPVPGSIRLPSLVTETSQQELPWDMRTPRNYLYEVLCAQRLKEAKEFFNNGQYVVALDLLEQIKSVISNHEGTTSWVLKYTIDSYIERINLLTISH